MSTKIRLCKSHPLRSGLSCHVCVLYTCAWELVIGILLLCAALHTQKNNKFEEVPHTSNIDKKIVCRVKSCRSALPRMICWIWWRTWEKVTTRLAEIWCLHVRERERECVYVCRSVCVFCMWEWEQRFHLCMYAFFVSMYACVCACVCCLRVWEKCLWWSYCYCTYTHTDGNTRLWGTQMLNMR